MILREGEGYSSDLNMFYCIYTYIKGLNTSSYNLRGSQIKVIVHVEGNHKLAITRLTSL